MIEVHKRDEGLISFSQTQAKSYRKQYYMPINEASTEGANPSTCLKCLNRLKLAPTYSSERRGRTIRRPIRYSHCKSTFDPRTCRPESSGRRKR